MRYQKIVCFGDSIALGLNDAEGGGWCDRLKRYCLSNFPETQVLNLGIGSETSDGLAGRFQTELAARVFRKEQTLIVLQCGLNDVVQIEHDKRRVPMEYFIRNLRRVIEQATSANQSNIDIAIMAITTIADEFDGVANHDRQVRHQSDIDKYNDALQKLAEQNGCQFIDVRDVELSEDGLHPSSVGHE
ncbi:MAG: SGNH/GDSL hydrolase family protein, partial [Kangiellaceae bacterium]|nr:SGNH/GDSL hydrolase family protein [Kangiellaceae bacterium]